MKSIESIVLVLALGAFGASCESEARDSDIATGSSCMLCHNGSQHGDYGGPGIQDPHPFPDAENLACTTCHGGDPGGFDKDSSHVPPPPEIGDRAFQRQNRFAFFNRLTLTGIDKLPDYVANGRTYTALDYLQFINPGDLRVAQDGRACGDCHQSHTETVAQGLLATEAGVLSGATFSFGLENRVVSSQGQYGDTAADFGFRAIRDTDFTPDPACIGAVEELLEFPVHSSRVEAADQIFRNDDYLAANLPADQLANGQIATDSSLSHLLQEQVAFTCGDCHLGSAGANNRFGDFRSSGCTSCHMPYSPSGRTGSRDPNVDRFEPLDVDDIEPGERSHIRSHRIVSAKKTLANGVEVEGMDDLTCAGCHQGSNRTVMQYWGIRLDQNQDVRRGVQYPTNPQAFRNTRNDTRLFDPDVNNRTFNGRNANQYLAFEDYDGDGRDDTPADVHHEAGMGCIDCHGSYDLHGGPTDGTAKINSRMEHGTAIQCESCHGDIRGYAPVVAGTAFDGTTADLAVDSKGNPLPHVRREADGHYYLYSKLTGARHYVTQTLDTVVDNQRRNTLTDTPIYSPRASYAMGCVDGDPATGIGPQQAGGVTPDFCHSDSMSCASCHSAWTNTCMGCHLEGEYNEGQNFSNITGERIVFRERNADFVYQSPLFFNLGIGPRNRIEQTSSNTKTFFKYRDRQGNFSKAFAFSDRNGQGNSSTYSSLGHNAIMAHSIRGRVDANNEGPRSCTACHLTQDGLTNYGAEYDAFRTAIAGNNYGSLDFNVLEQHFGQNTGNHLESPLYVHMVAGLGSGLFLFDENGCPTNPLDDDQDRKGCNDQAPSAIFDINNAFYDLDRIVRLNGLSTSSSNHVLLDVSVNRRDGAANPGMAGPLGASLVVRLTDPVNGIVLDSWVDSDGNLKGQASTFVQ